MAAKKKTQDRQFMEAAGGTATSEDAKSFLERQADEDREDAKARHANKGLKNAKDLVSAMQKAVAHGLSSESESVKAWCLEEIADLGNAVRDGCRAALRAAKTENRNVQD